MKNEKLFKGLFWGITVVIAGFSALFTSLFLSSIGFSFTGQSTTTEDDMIALIIMSIIILFVLIFAVIVGIIVFKDARKNGLNPWLWILVTMYAPNGIGIIIYLIVRYNEVKNLHCSGCGKRIEASYKLCPYCGQEQ